MRTLPLWFGITLFVMENACSILDMTIRQLLSIKISFIERCALKATENLRSELSSWAFMMLHRHLLERFWGRLQVNQGLD